MSDGKEEALRLIHEAVGPDESGVAGVVFTLVASRGACPISWASEQICRSVGCSEIFGVAAIPPILDTLVKQQLLRVETGRNEHFLYCTEQGLKLREKIGPVVHEPSLWRALASNRKP